MNLFEMINYPEQKYIDKILAMFKLLQYSGSAVFNSDIKQKSHYKA